MEPPTTPIRAVLFDFDGTLVDSEYLHHESWLEAVKPWGVTVPWGEYKRRLVGISDQSACEFFLRRAGLEPTPGLLDIGRRRKHRVYRRRSLAELAMDPIVLEWMHGNRLRVPMGVVSSSAVPDVIPILEQQGAARCLQCIVCGDHVERLKPDPMPYLLALRKIQGSVRIEEARQCLVFEDSQTGIQAAGSAGMTVHALRSPADLPDALEAWSGCIEGAWVR